MATAATQRNELMPRGHDGLRSGLALAALVHVALVIALAFGVNWHASEPPGIEAELWATVPQIAAQRDVAPDPKPAPKPEPNPSPRPEPKPVPKPEPKAEPKSAPDPQIAIEKAKQERLKKQKEEEKREQEEKLKLDKKKAQEDKARLDKAETDKQKKIDEQRNKNLARIKEMMGTDGGSPSGTAARSAGPSAGYAGRIIAAIKPNIVFPDMISGNPAAIVEVRLSSDGTIISRKLKQSSGVKEWDDAVLRALDKTEKLPRDTDGTVQPQIEMTFRPRDLS
jgi:colicin import membrane protein